jgi:hypothetical protein
MRALSTMSEEDMGRRNEGPLPPVRQVLSVEVRAKDSYFFSTIISSPSFMGINGS